MPSRFAKDTDIGMEMRRFTDMNQEKLNELNRTLSDYHSSGEKRSRGEILKVKSRDGSIDY